MNEFGEPNMGNPSVRFDEGRERVGHWPLAFQPILSRLLYNPGCVQDTPVHYYRLSISPVAERMPPPHFGLSNATPLP